MHTNGLPWPLDAVLKNIYYDHGREMRVVRGIADRDRVLYGTVLSILSFPLLALY